MNRLISLCMIVKNEEQVLARCLNSVVGLVDEIIIIDTGSTDNTKSIASQFTDHVYEYKWNNDFAAARNESLKHATSEWILVLDADEYVEKLNFEEFRTNLSSSNRDYPLAYNTKIMNFTDSGYDETKVTESSNPRLFNNFRQISYRQPIHEQLTSYLGKIHFSSISLTIYHSGYTAEIVERKDKSKRNMAIIQSMYQENKESPYYQFILGNEYMNSKEYDKALEVYRSSYIRSTERDAWFHHLLDRLISLEMQQGYYDKAYQYIRKGIECEPEKTDYYCLKGLLLEALGFWGESFIEFNRCITITEHAEKRNNPFYIVQPASGKIIPYQMLGEISRKKGDLPSAIQYWIKTLANQPKNFRVLQQLMDYLMSTNSRTEDVINILNKLYPVSSILNQLMLFKLALDSGHQQMVDYYFNLIDHSQITLNYSDTLQLNLFRKLSSSLVYDSDQRIPPSLAIAVSLVTGEAKWTELAAEQRELSTAFVLQAQQEKDSFDLENFELLLAQVLFLLWKYNYKEIYFELIEKTQSAGALNLLLGMFFESGRLEETLELSELLLNNQLLDSTNLEIIGQWYMNMGETETAYLFWEASCNIDPPSELLGKISCNFEGSPRDLLLEAFIRKHPDLSMFSI